MQRRGWVTLALTCLMVRYECVLLITVVSVQIFLLDYANTLPQLNEVYADCFPKGCQLPVRTAVGVAALPLGGSVEMTIVSGLSDLADGRSLQPVVRLM